MEFGSRSIFTFHKHYGDLIVAFVQAGQNLSKVAQPFSLQELANFLVWELYLCKVGN
jgi:hypothetical protein